MEQMMNERYEYVKELGRGGMGTVFLVYDRKLSKQWAVKKIKGKSDEELEALCTVTHFAYPRIVDYSMQGEFTYLIMDYIEGIALPDYMSKTFLTQSRIADFSLQIAEAFLYLHRHNPPIFFMDCKPANIMITAENKVKIVDFGSVYFDRKKDIHQRISGTAFYASREQKKGEHENNQISGQCDVYSMGMTMFFMTTGKEQEIRDRKGKLCVKQFNPCVSEGLVHIIEKCTRLNKEKRYQSMEEVINDVRNLKEVDRKERIKKFFYKMGLFAEKLILVWGVLTSALFLRQNQTEIYLHVSILFLCILFFSCRRKKRNYWEVEKETFRGCGRRFLYCLIPACLLAGSIKTFAVEETKYLKVLLKDNYNRNILIRKGTTYSVSKNINISIPIEELGQGENILTITCYNKETGVLSRYSQTYKKEGSSH